MPFPVPLAPAVTTIHESFLTAVQAQWDAVVTATVPDPPVAANVCVVGLIVYEQGAASWLTVNVLPATVSVVCRAAPVLAAAVTVTEPLPEPEALFIDTHDALASLAVFQEQPEGAVTLTVFEPPLAAKDNEVVDTEYVHVGVVGGGGVVVPPPTLLNAATVPAVPFRARTLSWVDVPVGRVL